MSTQDSARGLPQMGMPIVAPGRRPRRNGSQPPQQPPVNSMPRRTPRRNSTGSSTVPPMTRPIVSDQSLPEVRSRSHQSVPESERLHASNMSPAVVQAERQEVRSRSHQSVPESDRLRTSYTAAVSLAEDVLSQRRSPRGPHTEAQGMYRRRRKRTARNEQPTETESAASSTTALVSAWPAASSGQHPSVERVPPEEHLDTSRASNASQITQIAVQAARVLTARDVQQIQERNRAIEAEVHAETAARYRAIETDMHAETAAHRTEPWYPGAAEAAKCSRKTKKPKAESSDLELPQSPGEAGKSTEAEDCPICLAPLLGKCAKTECGHLFHLECLEKHLEVSTADRPSCPLCRAEMRIEIPVTAEATSGREIEVLQRVPPADSRCHFDRAYTFLSLGAFAGNPKMLYVRTSNDDRKTPSQAVMWTLTSISAATVYLNFRSEGHVMETGACAWLEKDGWSLRDMEGTVSSGFPSGIYEGPVFSKLFSPGEIRLKGSNCWEGTYFVFVEVHEDESTAKRPWDVVEVGSFVSI